MHDSEKEGKEGDGASFIRVMSGVGARDVF